LAWCALSALPGRGGELLQRGRCLQAQQDAEGERDGETHAHPARGCPLHQSGGADARGACLVGSRFVDLDQLARQVEHCRLLLAGLDHGLLSHAVIELGRLPSLGAHLVEQREGLHRGGLHLLAQQGASRIFVVLRERRPDLRDRGVKRVVERLDLGEHPGDLGFLVWKLAIHLPKWQAVGSAPPSKSLPSRSKSSILPFSS
jgi:hypothetical protein